MKTAKYNYCKVIQFGYNGQWSDESEYPTNSLGSFATMDENKAFRHDLKEYRLAHSGTGQTRVIFRKTKKD